MKKNYLLLLLLCFSITSVFSQVQIGQGTDINVNVPIEPFYGYTYSQVIYTASEINASGDITGISYSATAETTLANSSDWTVYMSHTTNSVFTDGTSWIPIEELTQIFTGTVTISDGIVTINFETPFNYNGTDNLVIAIDENQDGYDLSGHDFYCYSTGQARALVYYSDSINPDPNSPQDGTIKVSNPNINLIGISQECPNAVISLDGLIAGSASLSWSADGVVEFEYVLQESGSGEPDSGTPISDTSIQIDALFSDLQYDFFVRSVCDDIFSGWSSTSFTYSCPSANITSWTMTSDGVVFDGVNNDEIIGYQIEYSTEQFVPGDGTATVFEFDSFPAQITGLEMSTNYYFTNRSNCNNDYSSIWYDNGNDGPDLWTTTGLTCEPASNCTIGDGFSSLVFADINNADSGCSNAGFGNFTELSTDLAQGETYDAVMTTGYGNQYVRAWIDYNDDYEFTSDELVIDNIVLGEGLTAGTHEGTAQVAIAADANLGPHLMRFKSSWNTLVSEACDVVTWGEIEEYTVVIVESLSISYFDLLDLNIYPNPVNGDYVTIQSSVSGEKNIEVYDITGKRLINTILNSDKLDVSSVSSGVYLVKVTIQGQTKVSKLIIR
jgi:hypothetical protein